MFLSIEILVRKKSLVVKREDISVCYNSNLKVFIYTWLIVYAILNLVYSKEHVYYILLTYNIILLF